VKWELIRCRYIPSFACIELLLKTEDEDETVSGDEIFLRC
jgi:hypothetical protein